MHTKGRDFSVGQAVMVRNLRKGPKWVAGVISERKGPLTFLVEVEPNQYWRRHVDHIRDRSDSGVQRNLEEDVTDGNAEEEETETAVETEMAVETEDNNIDNATEQEAEDVTRGGSPAARCKEHQHADT